MLSQLASAGAVVAEHLFIADATRSRRVLVLEAGPFVLPEHAQNMPFLGGAPDLRVPWTNHPPLNYSGLIFAIGGRSLTWGGWSPELLDVEITAWPQAARDALRPAAPAEGYFAQASRQIGVKETNDFIYGSLHTALRKQLHAGLKTAGNETGFTFGDLLEHPAVRYPDPGEPPVNAAVLRDWLGLPPTDTTPEAELRELFKLEAPLAVQSTTLPGFFPTNKFSAVPGLIRAARLAGSEADGTGPVADARKRLMIVPNCHVQELITETQPDNWVRVTGVRVWQNGGSVDIPLAPPRNGRQSAVVIALGTIESTRLALTTFQQSLAGRAAQRMGTNLIAHLRSNLTIRVPRAAIAANLPPTLIPSLQCSALLVKGKAPNGRTFHFQITAAGLGKLGGDSEAELFKKIPTLEHLTDMLRANDDTVVVTIRGIGDMTPRNPDSFVDLSTVDTDFDRPKAVVHLGNAKASPQDFPGSTQTQNDRTTWDAMDAVSDKIALIFAGSQPFDILPNANSSIAVPAGTAAQRLAALAAFKNRRDDLGTTHHDAGTMRMGDAIPDAVTNDFGRIHETTNGYVAGPALFPTVGSPNPMLTGVALGRRTGDLLNGQVLPGPDSVVSPQPEAGFRPLFNGTAASFKNWRLAGPAGGGMVHLNGEMVSYGDGGLRLFYYVTEQFTDFTLRLQFRIFDPAAHNSGVFLRFPRPTLDLATNALKQRAAAQQARPIPQADQAGADNGAWHRKHGEQEDVCELPDSTAGSRAGVAEPHGKAHHGRCSSGRQQKAVRDGIAGTVDNGRPRLGAQRFTDQHNQRHTERHGDHQDGDHGGRPSPCVKEGRARPRTTPRGHQPLSKDRGGEDCHDETEHQQRHRHEDGAAEVVQCRECREDFRGVHADAQQSWNAELRHRQHEDDEGGGKTLGATSGSVIRQSTRPAGATTSAASSRRPSTRRRATSVASIDNG